MWEKESKACSEFKIICSYRSCFQRQEAYSFKNAKAWQTLAKLTAANQFWVLVIILHAQKAISDYKNNVWLKFYFNFFSRLILLSSTCSKVKTFELDIFKLLQNSQLIQRNIGGFETHVHGKALKISPIDKHLVVAKHSERLIICSNTDFVRAGIISI